ncbi:Lrp/AsnC family transcriptional regulator [Candidatus Woesearchaeota archaeon]|nr:Lrp/AsnC family transcriptional regulator [Candidatus Woesearchaeota archaeon]
MSYKLDSRDLKLLTELDLDSRQSFSELGKKLGLSKNAVAYRINNLKEEGIIKQFHTVVDIGKLGYISFRLYLNLQNTTPEKEEEIIDFLKQKENVTWLVSIEGDYDIGALILAKSVKEMNSLWKELLEKYVNYLEERLFTIMTHVSYYSRAYLTGQKHNDYEIAFITEPEEAKLDGTDIELLKLMAPDARARIIDLAGKLKITPKTVIARIRALEKKKVIIGYKTMFELDKLGYQYFKVHFRLHNTTKDKLRQMRSYIKQHPNIVYNNEVLGGDDVEMELQVRDLQGLRAIISEIKALFGEMIREYKTMLFYKEHKYLYLPVKL